jgi:hypothetical protein
MLKIRRRLPVQIAFLALMGLRANAQIPSPEMESFLYRYANFSKADLRAIDQAHQIDEQCSGAGHRRP